MRIIRKSSLGYETKTSWYLMAEEGRPAGRPHACICTLLYSQVISMPLTAFGRRSPQTATCARWASHSVPQCIIVLSGWQVGPASMLSVPRARYGDSEYFMQNFVVLVIFSHLYWTRKMDILLRQMLHGRINYMGEWPTPLWYVTCNIHGQINNFPSRI
jgi:hypothetical protein